MDILKLGTKDVVWLSEFARRTYVSTYETLLTKDEIEQRLQEKYSEEVFLQDLSDKKNAFFGAKLNDQWIAYLHLCIQSPKMELGRLYLDSGQQSKGYGVDILLFAENFAVQRDCESIYLKCFDKNVRALNFYEREGYTRTGVAPFKIKSVERNDILLEKDLHVGDED